MNLAKEFELIWVEPTPYDKIHLGSKQKHEYVDYMGGECMKCGYRTCTQSLTFHHLDPSSKRFSICHTTGPRGRDRDYKGGTSGHSKTEIYEELDKCALLCHNCHYELEAGLWKIVEIERQLRMKQLKMEIL